MVEPDESELRRRFEIERRLATRLRQADKSERQDLYAEVYESYYRECPPAETGVDPVVVDLQRRLLDPYLDPETRFLEYGAGAAGLAASLVGEIAEITVVEAADAAILGNDPTLANAIRWLPPSAAATAIKAGSIDLAFSSHFVEHLHPEDLVDHLRKVLEALVPGGCYIVVTPNRLCGPHDVSGHFCRQAQGFHLCEYTHGELAVALRRVGFAPVRALRGIARRPMERSLLPIVLAERALLLLGSWLRRRLYESSWLRARRPFRPLEQVVLLGRAPT